MKLNKLLRKSSLCKQTNLFKNKKWMHFQLCIKNFNLKSVNGNVNIIMEVYGCSSFWHVPVWLQQVICM
jgi:hypothetical protein